MQDIGFRIGRLLWYVLKARHRHGAGVHSPFAYDKITRVFEEKCHYYIYNDVEKERLRLLKDKSKIDFEDYGTKPSGKRRICDIANEALNSRDDAQLIFRIALDNKPKVTIELGTSLGLTTAYLSKATHGGVFHTFDGCKQVVRIAKDVANNCGTRQETVFHVGNIDETLPEVLKDMDKVDVAFMDANHTKEATLKYFSMLEPKFRSASVLIMDDIHSSKGMEEAWNEIKAKACVTVTFDMLGLGVIYFNDKLTKRDYIYYRG